VRREVLYNIPIEFGVPMKLVRLNEICSKVHKGKHLSDAVLPLLFNFVLEYAIMKVQEN
jgi:hypothetical protein